MSRNERTKLYFVMGIRQWLKSNPRPGPLDAPVEYLSDLPGGALVKVIDPTLGDRIFEVKVVQRKNMGDER